MDIIICVGISGSGKSTWTSEILRNVPNSFRINRDSLRLSIAGTLDGYYQHPNLMLRESIVTSLTNKLLKELRYIDHSTVILDNTNVDQKYLIPLIKMFEKDANVSIKFFDIDVDTAKNRVLSRDTFLHDTRDVEYIDKQNNQYIETKKKIELLYPHLIIN